MKYLKIYTDFVKDMNELGDAERGRLFTAMLIYADTGIEPDFKGNERFLWGTAKKNIDSQRKSFDRKSAAGTASANERWNKEASGDNANGCQTMPNDANGCQKCQTHQEQEQEHEHEQEQEHKREKEIKEKEAPKAPDPFAEFAKYDPELLEKLEAFEEMRKKIRKPMTPHAKELIIRDLQKYDCSLWIPMIEQSIKNSWQGIFPLHQDRGKTANMLDGAYQMMAEWAHE